jgi:hypothetical protein
MEATTASRCINSLAFKVLALARIETTEQCIPASFSFSAYVTTLENGSRCNTHGLGFSWQKKYDWDHIAGATGV